MDDDDGFSDGTAYSSDAYGENSYLNELYQRLTAEASGASGGMNEYDSDNSDELPFVMLDDGDDDITFSPDEDDLEFDNEVGMSTVDEEDEEDEDDEDDDMSEASTVLNEDHPHASQSGTDTETEQEQQQPLEQPADVEAALPAQEENIVQSQKKIKLDEPEPVLIDDIANESLDEDQKCPICLETWSNAGEHRLCSLRCGHLFGLKCITQWFAIAQNATARKCPECNTKASKKDIRILYAKKLLCIDTSEIEKLKEQLKEACTRRDNAERELKQCQSKEKLYKQEMDNLKSRIRALEQTVKTAASKKNSFSVQYDNIVLREDKIFDICNNATCRVMSYNPWHKILAVSSGNSMRRVFLDTMSLSSIYNLHHGTIRDLAFQEQHPNILLSVGFDKKIMLTDIRTNVLTHSYQQESNLWSCCWSNYNHQTFFVGGHKGDVTEYDIRYLQGSLKTADNPNDKSPVASLASVPTSNSALCAGGYLSCQLNACYAYAFKEGNYARNRIDLEGPFTSLRYNERDNHVLVSCRANAKNPSVRNIVCSIRKSEDQIHFNTVHAFNAGSKQTLLSRPCYMNLQNDTMVVAYNGSSNCISAWSISTGQEAYSIPIAEPVVDICSFESGSIYQAVLTSNKVHLYHHKDSSF